MKKIKGLMEVGMLLLAVVVVCNASQRKNHVLGNAPGVIQQDGDGCGEPPPPDGAE